MIAEFILYKLLGWRITGDIPKGPQYVFLAVPHTSNWDFVLAYITSKAVNIELKIFAKDTFHIFPLNFISKALGVLPVNRRESTNLVDQIVDMFKKTPELVVAITPEGTRDYRATLKSGYYHVARKADVPIVLVNLEYDTKTVVIMPPRKVLDTFEEDQAAIIEIAKKVNTKFPEKTFR